MGPNTDLFRNRPQVKEGDEVADCEGELMTLFTPAGPRGRGVYEKARLRMDENELWLQRTNDAANSIASTIAHVVSLPMSVLEIENRHGVDCQLQDTACVMYHPN
jgi:hypothetical protein